MTLASRTCSVEICGAESRRLELRSIHNSKGHELLSRPSAFLAINGVAALVTTETVRRIDFTAAGVSGSIMPADGEDAIAAPQLVVSLCSKHAQTVRLDLGFVRTPADADTVWFNPRNGGSLVHRRQSYDAIYPGDGSVCVIFAHQTRAGDSTGRAGPVLGFLNEEQRRIKLSAHIAPDESVLSASFEALEIPAQESLVLPSLYISIAEDWAQALEPYRLWLQRIYRPRDDTPEWVSRANWHFFTLRISSFPDRETEKLKDEIDRGVGLCRTIGASPLFWLGHWWSRCREMRGRWNFDHVQGDFLEVPDATRRAIKQCHANGARVLVYLNITAIGELSETYHADDGKLLLDRNERPVRNAEYPMVMLCPKARGTRTYWFTVIDFLFGELDIDGVFLDQAGGGYRAPYCYATDHGHAEIDVYGRGMLELLSAVRQRIHAHDPEAIVVGELSHDLRTRYVDYWLWHWNWGRIEGRSAYGEALVWMRSLCPDARFVEQEAYRAAPIDRALEMAGRGVWINATYMPRASQSAPVGRVPALPSQPDYHEAIWRAQRKDSAILTCAPRVVYTGTDEESGRCAAVVFGDLGTDNRALVSILHPDAGDHEVELHLPGNFQGTRATPWPQGIGAGTLNVFATQPEGCPLTRHGRGQIDTTRARATFSGRSAIFLIER